MSERINFPDWPRAIFYVLILSLVIVSLDLLVEVIVNPSATSILDRLLYRFGLMLVVSFLTLIVAFYLLKRALFGVPMQQKSAIEL